jgi:Transposase IS66 family
MALGTNADGLDYSKLLFLVEAQSRQLAELLAREEERSNLVAEVLAKDEAKDRLIAELFEEIARLKGLKGRPDIKPNKPSGMEQATSGKPKGERSSRRRGKKRTPAVKVEECVIPVVPGAGWRLKGYEDFVVQDLLIQARVIHFRRERWLTPDGRTVTAPLPPGINGGFGPDLRRYVLMQYHQGQVTMPRLVAQLESFGIDISKRQLVRLLIGEKEPFIAEAADVLQAGLADAPWVTVDDTGARHKGKNGYCTHIGNDDFAWFKTTGSKSRHNFLGLLRAGYDDYVINDEALAYMRSRSLSEVVIGLLANHLDRHFADHAAWQAHLEKLGIAALTVAPNPPRIATEGAVWGSIKSHGFLKDTVIVSDDAGQFNIGIHALCWIHMERLIYKIHCRNDHDRAAQEHVRGLVWDYYRDLKAWCKDPLPERCRELRARFDEIFRQKTGAVMLDRLLKRIYANRSELLVVLDRPEIPLHTNGSENAIRCQVTKRKISGGTRSDVGRDCRDAFLGIAKTCTKLGYSFWDYLGARLMTPGHKHVPYLPDLVASRYATA